MAHKSFIAQENRILQMSLLPGVTNSYFEAFALGLSYGVVFCTSACLPYIASYIAGIGAGFRKGIAVTLIYNFGRVAAYALVGAVIGGFKLILDSATLSPFQTLSSIAFATITILIGANLVLKSRKSSASCDACSENNQNIRTQNLGEMNGKFDVRAFSLGLSRGLIICPPLLALITYSASGAAPFDSFVLAVLFGIGTAFSPTLFLGGVTGWLLGKAPLFKKWISIGGGLLLIAFGIFTLVNTILTV